MKEKSLSGCFTNPAGGSCDQDSALWLGHQGDMEECAKADIDDMKQLPGRTPHRWQQRLLSGLVVGLGMAVMVVLLPIILPIMLIVGMFAGLALIPILRELRHEFEQLDRHQRPSAQRLPMDVTPWQRRLWNRWRASIDRRS